MMDQMEAMMASLTFAAQGWGSKFSVSREQRRRHQNEVGLVLNSRERWNHGNTMIRASEGHTLKSKHRKSDRERQISYDTSYVCNL